MVVAAVLALTAGSYVAFCFATAGVPPDFEFWWRGSRLLLAGIDPYVQVPGTPPWPLPDRLFYPLPTLLLSAPVAPLSLAAAGAVAMGAAVGALAYALTRNGWWRLWALASPAFVMALKVGQWSPLLCVAALVPALGGLAVVKPTLGAAVLAYRLDWRGALAAAALAAASLAVLPAWPREWLANLRYVDSHPAPVATWGAFALLGLLRWRQPEARLLVAMACVPQLLYFADQLPLALVARTPSEAKFLAGCGIAAWAGWMFRLAPGDYYVLDAAPWVLGGVYLPALLVVLRRPNAREGA